MRPLIVGESNPYGTDPGFALYPLPEHASGGRLARILVMTADEYLAAFDRVNLLHTERWSVPNARKAARELLDYSGHNAFVLLGARVAKAFTGHFEPFSEYAVGITAHAYVIPHPSGLSRLWYERGSHERARELVARAIARAAKYG